MKKRSAGPKQGPRRGGGDAEAKFEQAVKAFQKGDFRQAKKIVLRLEKTFGSVPQLTHLRGFIELELGNLPAAIKALQAAKVSFANDADLINALGSAFRRSGDVQAAVQEFKQAAALAPRRPEILANLGNAFSDAGDREAAIEAYGRALQINPAMNDVRRSLVSDLMAAGSYPEASAELEVMLAQDPDDTWALLMLADEDAMNFRYDKAKARYGQLLEAEPSNVEARLGLADMAVATGRPRDALAQYARLNQAADAPPGPVASEIMCRNYLPETTPAVLRDAGAAWERRFALPPLGVQPRASGTGPLRVGVLSGKLGGHPCGQFLKPFLENIDPARIQVELFAYGVKPHPLADELRRLAGEWHDVSTLEEDGLLTFLASRELDVLISSTGIEEGNLLRLFTARPAPVQVVGFAHFGTTGMTAMDGIVADPYHIPPDAEDGYAERVLRLPGSYLTYRPPSYLPALSGRPAAEASPLTFGCFNGLPKLCDETLALWARVLEAAPGSRLILKAGPLADAATRQHLAERFAALGVEQDRLDLRAGSPHAELLETYNEIDLALDPLVYSGGLTTLEALWMGVPVVTLPGETFARRHSLSHLSNAGLDRFVVRSADDYVRIAASFPDVMAEGGLDRAAVREAVAGAPMSDAAGYADALTSALENLVNLRD